MAIGIGIATLLLGSVVFSFLIPSDDVLSPQEKKCQEIANEGYRIHTFTLNLVLMNYLKKI